MYGWVRGSRGSRAWGHVSGVRLADGEIVPADVVLVGVGVLPNMELALEAGLVCGNGIVVDAQMRTSHPDVFASGRRRLAAAGALRARRPAGVGPQRHRGRQDWRRRRYSGTPPPTLEAPWFWSDQFDLKLQTAGLWTGADERSCAETPQSRAFAVFYLKEGRVIAVDAVNSAPGISLSERSWLRRRRRLRPAN